MFFKNAGENKEMVELREEIRKKLKQEEDKKKIKIFPKRQRIQNSFGKGEREKHNIRKPGIRITRSLFC